MSSTLKEIWKPIPIEVIKDEFEISNFGLIRYTKTKKIKPRGLKSGYPCLRYTYILEGKRRQKSIKVHKLVAKVFVHNDNPENKTIANHLNGDKFDSRASNLEWTTNSGNVQHAIDNGLITITKRAVVQYNLQTDKKIKIFESILQASKELNISDSAICNACSGKKISAGGYKWKYVKENPNQTTNVNLSTFKQIDGFPNYLINAKGQIYSLPYKKFLKFQKHPEGCLMIQLTNIDQKKDFLVHRLVGSYFLEKKNKKHNSIHHKDGNKTNNNVKNLKWCYVNGVEAPPVKFHRPFYNSKTAIKPPKRKSIHSGPKDLLTANPKNLSKKQREERKRLLTKKSGSKTTKTKPIKQSKLQPKKKIIEELELEN